MTVKKIVFIAVFQVNNDKRMLDFLQTIDLHLWATKSNLNQPPVTFPLFLQLLVNSVLPNWEITIEENRMYFIRTNDNRD